MTDLTASGELTVPGAWSLFVPGAHLYLSPQVPTSQIIVTQLCFLYVLHKQVNTTCLGNVNNFTSFWIVSLLYSILISLADTDRICVCRIQASRHISIYHVILMCNQERLLLNSAERFGKSSFSSLLHVTLHVTAHLVYIFSLLSFSNKCSDFVVLDNKKECLKGKSKTYYMFWVRSVWVVLMYCVCLFLLKNNKLWQIIIYKHTMWWTLWVLIAS